jgi:twitching motility protein PilU
VRKKNKKGRIPAIEILLNTPMMADLILKGKVHAMKELMSKSNEQGMCTFDQSLFRLIDAGIIDTQEGMRHADSTNELRLQLKLNSRFANKNDFFKGTDKLSIEDIDDREA